MIDSQEELRSIHANTAKSTSTRRRIFYIAFIYLCLLLLLVAVEIGFRLFLPHISSLDLFVTTPQQKLQVANEIQATIFEGDPLLLWRLKPNLNEAIWDFTVLSTNAQHIRSDHATNAKPPGTFRIVCLGDSVTFGYRVPAVWPDKPKEYDHEWLPFPMLLEKHLQQANPGKSVEAFAMAVPGYTSHQGLAWLRRDIDLLQPDLLIVSFGWNDASFGDIADRDAIKVTWYAVSARWLIDRSQVFAHAAHWLRSRKQLISGPVVRPASRVSDQEYVSNIRAIVNLARGRGAKVIVMAAPYRDKVTNPTEAQLMIRYRNQLRSAMQQDQVPFLEILELTEAAYPANEAWFGELIHPNHMGHRLITYELVKLFQQNHLLNDLNRPVFLP